MWIHVIVISNISICDLHSSAMQTIISYLLPIVVFQLATISFMLPTVSFIAAAIHGTLFMVGIEGIATPYSYSITGNKLLQQQLLFIECSLLMAQHRG